MPGRMPVKSNDLKIAGRKNYDWQLDSHNRLNICWILCMTHHCQSHWKNPATRDAATVSENSGSWQQLLWLNELLKSWKKCQNWFRPSPVWRLFPMHPQGLRFMLQFIPKHGAPKMTRVGAPPTKARPIFSTKALFQRPCTLQSGTSGQQKSLSKGCGSSNGTNFFKQNCHTQLA